MAKPFVSPLPHRVLEAVLVCIFVQDCAVKNVLEVECEKIHVGLEMDDNIEVMADVDAAKQKLKEEVAAWKERLIEEYGKEASQEIIALFSNEVMRAYSEWQRKTLTELTEIIEQ